MPVPACFTNLSTHWCAFGVTRPLLHTLQASSVRGPVCLQVCCNIGLPTQSTPRCHPQRRDTITMKHSPAAASGTEAAGCCGAESALVRGEGSGGSFSMLSVASCSPFCSSVSCLQAQSRLKRLQELWEADRPGVWVTSQACELIWGSLEAEEPRKRKLCCWATGNGLPARVLQQAIPVTKCIIVDYRPGAIVLSIVLQWLWYQHFFCVLSCTSSGDCFCSCSPWGLPAWQHSKLLES